MSEPHLSIRVANDLKELAVVAERVDEFCGQYEISPTIAYHVNLSLDELLNNTISYGYDDDEQHRIDLTLRAEGETLLVVIEDDGRAFDSSLAREPDVDATLEERSLGGLGLFLVQQMMDEVVYQRTDNRNVITLTKHTTEQPDQ